MNLAELDVIMGDKVFHKLNDQRHCHFIAELCGEFNRHLHPTKA